MQFRLWHIARSVLSNWVGMAATLSVGFFLQPYMVHRLGNTSYGIWVLTVSVVGYLVLLDLGMGSSVIRYISKGHSTGDHEGASDSLSAVLWVRLQIAALIIVISGALCLVFTRLFPIPAGMVGSARLALVLVSLTTASSMVFGVFSSVLSALNRYDLRTVVSLVQLAVRVAGLVYVLHMGRGIVAVAFCELIATSVGNFLLYVMSQSVYPELIIKLRSPRREVLRSIWSYSGYAFLITVAVQLVYQSDNMVVGAFVSTSAVTFYSIGNTLCRYTQQLIGSMTATFCPAASTFEAVGDIASLRSLYYNGTRATMVISLPIVITLIFRGQTFIRLWMGPQYAHTSGIVLAILATALMFSLQNLTAGAVAMGMEKHKKMAQWALIEGVANLILSIFLARRFGIYGVALGTLVPSLFVQIIFWPRYVGQLVQVTALDVFRVVWGPVFASAIPYALVTYALDRYYPPRNVNVFILEVLITLPIFLAAVLLIFRRSVAREILPRLRSFFNVNAEQN